MALSLIGWLSGITAAVTVLFAVFFGLWIIYKSKKTNAKLLFAMGLLIICAGLPWLGTFIDFLVILFTGNNFPFGTKIPPTSSTYLWDCVFAWMWIGPIALLMIYISAGFLTPKKKRYINSKRNISSQRDNQRKICKKRIRLELLSGR